MEKLLVATYDQDLLQFEMFCYCINKNWQGNQFLTVVLGQGTDIEKVRFITDSILPEWTVEINQCATDNENGYLQQEINKVVYSIDQRFSDVIVFDSKDFMIRPCQFALFRYNGKYRATYYYPDQHLVDICPGILESTTQDVSKVPFVLNLTPWIWNVEQLSRCWKNLNQRFGDYRQWQRFHGGSEIYSFFAFTWTDTDSLMSWHRPDENPLIIGGGWTHQTYEGIVQEAQDFDRWTERKIWKHSRKLEDPRCLDVTRSVLLKYGIEQEIIDRVFGRQGTPGESS